MEDQAAKLRQLVDDQKEYMPQPEHARDGKFHLIDPAAHPEARVIAITSGKGGVGKTNLAVNLALALRAEGKRVLVIDADLGMANVDVLLGTMARKHLLDLLEPATVLKDVLVHDPFGIDYISGGSGIEKAQAFSFEEKKILMEKLMGCGDIADIILVDTGAGLGKNVMDFILAADEVLLVTTPEPTSMTDAYAIMKAYSMYAKEPNLRLVVNRVYEETESLDVTEKLKQTSEKFLHMTINSLGYIYEDRAVLQAVRKQRPFLMMDSSSIASKCIKAIAKSLLYGDKMAVKQGWQGFLRQIFNFSR